VRWHASGTARNKTSNPICIVKTFPHYSCFGYQQALTVQHAYAKITM
jgi:hypothetical protein